MAINNTNTSTLSSVSGGAGNLLVGTAGWINTNFSAYIGGFDYSSTAAGFGAGVAGFSISFATTAQAAAFLGLANLPAALAFTSFPTTITVTQNNGATATIATAFFVYQTATGNNNEIIHFVGASGFSQPAITPISGSGTQANVSSTITIGGANTGVTNPVTGFNSTNSGMYSTEEGLKLPSGNNASQPTGVQGMIRNNTGENTGGSASAIEHYNGTKWQYFVATESVDNPFFASQNFNTVLWDGDGGSSRNITQVGFDPDFVWIKKRQNDTKSHRLFDSVRTAGNVIYSDLTNQQASPSNELNAFITDGFNIGNASSVNDGASGDTYVSWNWKGGGLINESADFNGSSSYITPSSSSTLTGLTKAVSIWIKSDNFTSIGTWPFQQGNGQGAENYIRFYNGNDIQIRWGNQTLTSSGYSTGVWYHIVAQEDANGFANFWIDGVEIATSTSSPLSVTGDTNIGRRFNSPSYQYYFNGQMAQLRLFSSSLDSTQIAQLYNETKADNSVLNYPSGAGCIAAYPLGENANGLDGLYNGTASNVTFGKPGYLTRNTEGTIESTVSTNVAAGFSIVSYTGNGNAGATVGHGIDTPELVIVKRLSGIENWAVYSAYSHPTVPQNYLLTLDNTSAAGLNSTRWNNTAPTNAVFSVGTSQAVNASANTYIAYCWHSVAGYSKISSYVGNGNATGVLQELGFEPAFLMFKCVSAGPANWIMIDNKRATSNPRTPHLRANTSGTDDTGTNEYVDFTSTGFQPKGVSNYNNNSLDEIYMYMAFATS